MERRESCDLWLSWVADASSCEQSKPFFLPVLRSCSMQGGLYHFVLLLPSCTWLYMCNCYDMTEPKIIPVQTADGLKSMRAGC
jgi:hypothetical protein